MKLISLLCVLLSVHNELSADKIEKKGSLLNASCKPFGLSCKTIENAEFVVTYVYNDPSPGSFSMQINESDLKRNPVLEQEFRNRSMLTLSEDLVLPPDITTALKMPMGYRVAKGQYPVYHDQQKYRVVFQK